jgi:hypothetical protein
MFEDTKSKILERKAKDEKSCTALDFNKGETTKENHFFNKKKLLWHYL